MPRAATDLIRIDVRYFVSTFEELLRRVSDGTPVEGAPNPGAGREVVGLAERVLDLTRIRKVRGRLREMSDDEALDACAELRRFLSENQERLLALGTPEQSARSLRPVVPGSAQEVADRAVAERLRSLDR